MVTSFYAALLTLMFVALSIRTVRLRAKLKIAVGTNDNAQLLRATRVHANFAEYVPLSLLLLFMLEQQSHQPLLINGLGILLILGRVFHSYGVSQVNEDIRYRQIGMALTFMTLITTSITLLIPVLL